MNSKAIKRQLLAAIAMVLVAALALGSSTYAWFVASGTVTAEGMNVHATSEGGLVIAYGLDGAWGISASAEADTADVALNPTSTADLTNWYHATAEKAALYGADDTTREDVTTRVMDGNSYRANGGNSANTYVVARTFYIRSTGNDAAATLAKGLYVSNITVTGATGSLPLMDTALRVGIVCEHNGTVSKGTGNTPFIYGPVTATGGTKDDKNTAKDNYDVFSEWDEGAGKCDKVGTVALKKYGEEGKNDPLLSADTVILNSDDTSKYVKVTVLIWYEGEDWNLNSDRYDPQKLNVTVDFSSLGTNGTTQVSGG